MKKFLLILMPIFCVLCIAVIFKFSSDPNSNKKTEQISKKIESRIATNNSKAAVKKINFTIRKAGHFFEFFTLGVLLYITSCLYSLKLRNSLPYMLFIILFVANLDEYYQSFIGRTSKVADSLIDLCGGVSGILVTILIQSFFSEWKHLWGTRFKQKNNKF